MKLILSAFLRTLRERDEFDALLPDLLLAMGIIPLSKPQTGTRQFGVDLSAVGKDTDGVEKLFLFVLKKGDIGRSTWDGAGPQTVHPTLNEIFDVYLRSHVPSKYANHQVKVVLGTTGDLKEEVQANWAGYTASKPDAEFDFWGADRLAELVEHHMLDEYLFQADDRTDLRRTLALIGEPDYALGDYHRLILRQLGLNSSGELFAPKTSQKNLIKAITRVNLMCRLVTSWATNDGDTRAALKVAERTLLWTWRRILFAPDKDRKKITQSLHALLENYFSNARDYVNKIKPHSHVRDGLSGYTAESAIFALTVFEHIGLLASNGISLVYCGEEIEGSSSHVLLDDVIEALSGIISNNPVSGSPSLDGHSIDINLGMIFLVLVGQEELAKKWLSELVYRTDYTFKKMQHFPVDSDSLDDLIELEFAEPSVERRKELMQTSWTLPMLAGWCVILEESELYAAMVSGHGKDAFPEVCRQLWHPVKEDFFDYLYFQCACYESGESEAPITFDKNMGNYSDRMKLIIGSDRHEVVESSPGYQSNLFGLDFIAMRHFRTPIPPMFWYKFLNE